MNPASERLPLHRAAYVVARRDFVAILFSRAFFFFLLGPLFPLFVGALAGGVGARVESSAGAAQIGLAMASADVDAMLASRERLASALGPGVPQMVVLRRLQAGESYDPGAVLAKRRGSLGGVLTGTVAHPVLTATSERLQWWRGTVSLIAAQAGGEARPLPRVTIHEVAASGASEQRGRLRTAQAGQLLLFLLTMLLAGMVLSNLVEEKGNKIIEILAAAIPMDAVFLGKLFAMLAVSLVGLAVWASVIGTLVILSHTQTLSVGVLDFSHLPEPAIGWAGFVLLGIAYFSMSYLLLGSVFLAIGSLATTVREVQTLSMPVTMLQVLLFFFASLAMADDAGWIAWAAMLFPFSSPYLMLARAAMDGALWPHLLALAWQAMWVAISIRVGATLFRKRVMHSGPRGVKKRARWRRTAGAAGEVAAQGASH
jgi:ABC-2 type transport system permease protein